MHMSKRHLAAAGLALALGCNRGVSAQWSTAARAIHYDVLETAPSGSMPAPDRRFAIDLAFAAGGALTVTEMGSAAAATMDHAGHLALADLHAPPVNYEPVAIAVLPPAAPKVSVGDSWSIRRPSDDAAASASAIVLQEEFDYRVLDANATTIKVQVNGALRIAPSPALDRLVAQHSTLPAAVATPLITRFSPYVAGTAEFDVAGGSTVSAEGTMLPWSFLHASGYELGSDPARLAYTVTRR
jgi:hypothetical protein